MGRVATALTLGLAAVAAAWGLRVFPRVGSSSAPRIRVEACLAVATLPGVRRACLDLPDPKECLQMAEVKPPLAPDHSTGIVTRTFSGFQDPSLRLTPNRTHEGTASRRDPGALELYKRGEEALNSSDYKRASQFLSLVVDREPDWTQARALLREVEITLQVLQLAGERRVIVDPGYWPLRHLITRMRQQTRLNIVFNGSDAESNHTWRFVESVSPTLVEVLDQWEQQGLSWRVRQGVILVTTASSDESANEPIVSTGEIISSGFAGPFGQEQEVDLRGRIETLTEQIEWTN